LILACRTELLTANRRLPSVTRDIEPPSTSAVIIASR